MLHALLDAVAFLTRVPVPQRQRFDLARAAWAFPVVGAGVGVSVGIVALVAHLVLPLYVAVLVAVVADILLTGALHLDGPADCADGCGGSDRATRLRIMKDHAVGVYGALALALAVLLQVALLHAVLVAVDGWGVLAVTGAAGGLSRALVLVVALRWPYARDEGTGRALVTGLSLSMTTLAVSLAVAGAGVAGVLLGVWPMVGLLLGAVLMSWLVGAWAGRTLGGVTGDVCGASIVLTHLAALLGALAFGL